METVECIATKIMTEENEIKNNHEKKALPMKKVNVRKNYFEAMRKISAEQVHLQKGPIFFFARDYS